MSNTDAIVDIHDHTDSLKAIEALVFHYGLDDEICSQIVDISVCHPQSTPYRNFIWRAGDNEVCEVKLGGIT